MKGMPLLHVKDLSIEFTVEKVAEAIQDLRQDVWHARRERVMFFLILCCHPLWVSLSFSIIDQDVTTILVP